jgi:glycosyltransferase involved in cell wall biosynthesis
MLDEAGFDVSCLFYDPRHEPPFYPLAPGVRLVNLHSQPSWLERAASRATRKYKRGRALAPLDWGAKNLAFTQALARQFRERQPNLVIAFMPPANTPALLAGRMTGTRVVATNHNVPEQDYLSKTRWDQNPIDRKLRAHALRYAYRVHVLFEEFGKWFPSEIQEKIVVIKNYVSDVFVAPPVDAPRKKAIVASGRLAEVKNYLALVEAWRELHDEFPDWEVLIYGDGPQRRALEGRIAQYGLGDRVRLMGNSTNIDQVYREAEILCHPAHFEGFGLSVAEALASGMPVVAYSDCAGVNQFVFDGENGLLVDRRSGTSGLADGLRRLMSDSALRRKLRERAPGSVAAFSKNAYFESWKNLIQGAVRPP